MRTYSSSRLKNEKIIVTLLVTICLVSALAIVIPVTTAKKDPSKEPKFRRSDNPILHLPVDEEEWLPIMPPELSELPPDKDDERYMDIEIYDVKTKKIKKTTKDKTTTNITLKTPENQGLFTSELFPENVIGDDDRIEVTDTTVYPWSSICRLYITAADGTKWMATGFIIDGSHILTAGHVVYKHDNGGWVSSIKIVPAFDDGYTPYWHAWATIFRTYTGWTSLRSSQHDWAFLTLDRNVGIYTGWMGIMTADPSDSVYTGTLNTAGYPGDLGGGNFMYFDSDSGAAADQYNHWYYMDTAGGQSGSPVWSFDGTSRNVLSVHAYGGTLSNKGTRIDSTKFDDIVDWFSIDVPPNDYANLIDDGQLYSGFTSTTVVSGETSFNVWSDVRNIGTAESGGFQVSYYASTDTYITASDHLIGTVSVSSILPFYYEDSEWSGTFPSHIPSGTYWVGWIIDSTDAVPEPLDGGEYNNVAYKDSYQLTVESPALITYYTNPNYDVSITFDYDDYTDGQSGSYIPDSYMITANAPTGYAFHHWEYDNIGAPDVGVYVPDITANPGTATVSGDGWLKAVFSALITFRTEPSNAGSITYNGNVYSDGQSIWEVRLPPDNTNIMAITANPSDNYTFSHWDPIGQILVDSTTSITTDLTVNGPGVLTAVFERELVVDYVMTTDYVERDWGEYGDTMVVLGSGAKSGAAVNLYWDFVTASGLLNTTVANPDGSFEVRFDVPEAVAGAHYIWVRDMDTDVTAMWGPFTVYPPTPPLPPILSNLTITPAELELGDNVTISVDIENIDSQSFTYIVTMQIGELTILIDVDLEAYESKTVSHTITPDAVGEYNVTVNELTGSFTVVMNIIFSATDYLLFNLGHSNTFTASDNYLSNCTVELVFQNATEENYLITLTQLGEEGGYWCDSAIFVGEHDGLIMAWGGAPVGNQANFFSFLYTIPETFYDGETWINKYYDSSHEASYVGDITINDVSYSDCILLRFDSTSNSNTYLQGVGEAYLAKDVGIIKITFNKTDGNHFTATLKEHSDYAQRRISGYFILDSGSPAWGYSVGLSNAVNVGYDATLVDVNGSYSLPFYGSSIILRYGPISMDGRSLMHEHSQEDIINGAVGDIVDYNLTAPDVGLAGPLEERPPELITWPQNVTIPDDRILFNGRAISVNEIKNVSVNGELASGLFSGIYYFWQKEITLTEGMNDIQITAYDNGPLQKSTSKNLWINYEKDAYYGPRVEPVPLDVLPENRQVLTFIIKPNGTVTSAYLNWAPSYEEHSPFQHGRSLGYGYDGYDDITITYDIADRDGALEVGEEIDYRVHVGSSGYWASHDVITITVGSPDYSPPWVESVSPLPGEQYVPTNSSIDISFNEQLNHLTLTPDNILVNSVPFAGEIEYDFQSHEVTLLPGVPFQPDIKISIELTSGITDYAGNNLTAYSWDFYTHEVEDLILEGNEILIIENCVYNHSGNIIVRDNASLILRNATLALYWQSFHKYDISFQGSSYFESFNSTITDIPFSFNGGGYYLFMRDSSFANITSSRFHYPATLLDARGQNVTVKILDSHLDYINIGSYSNVEINNSQATVSIYYGSPNVTIRDSKNIGQIRIRFSGTAYADLSLQPGYHSYWSLQENETISNCDIEVTIFNSTVSGWGLNSYSQNDINVRDSILNSVVSSAEASFNLENVTVTSRISSEDNSSITLRDSTIRNLDTYDSSKVQMVNTSIDTYGEVNVFNESEIYIGWYLDVTAINEAGPIEGAIVEVYTMPDLSLVDSKLTNEDGLARFDLWEKILRANGAESVNDYNIDCEYQEVRLSEEIILTSNDELLFDFTGIYQYSVSGTVFFGSTPLDNILVELTRDGEEIPILSTTTSPEGFYSFSDVASGLYWVTAYAPPDQGYVPDMGYRFEVIDEDVTKDIDLPKLLILLSPEYGSYVASSNPTFEWVAFPNAVRCSISVHDTYDWLLNPVWEDTDSTTSHTLQTELSDGKRYSWSIYAYDSNDHLIGNARPWWSFTIGTPAPPPPIPHQFYGTVTIDGSATDGISVEAKIDGVTYLSTTTLEGQYGYTPTFTVPADAPETVEIEGGVSGDTVEFYVGGVLAATYTNGVPVDPVVFANGGVTELDLVVVGIPSCVSIGSAAIAPGQVTEVPVNMSHVTKVAGLGFDLYWDPSVISINDIKLSDDLSTTNNTLIVGIDLTLGKATVALFNTHTPDYLTWVEERTILIVEIEAIGPHGTSSILDLEEVEVTDAETWLPSPVSNVEDGMVTIQNLGSIHGYVTYSYNGAPMEGAIVDLSRYGSTLNTIVTGVSGEYEFLDVLMGEYNLTASHGRIPFDSQYTTFWNASASVNVIPGETTEVDFSLKIRGDLNDQGEVDIGDVAKIANMYVGNVPEEVNVTDFNGNGELDIGDVAKLANYYVENIDEV